MSMCTSAKPQNLPSKCRQPFNLVTVHQEKKPDKEAFKSHLTLIFFSIHTSYIIFHVKHVQSHPWHNHYFLPLAVTVIMYTLRTEWQITSYWGQKVGTHTHTQTNTNGLLVTCYVHLLYVLHCTFHDMHVACMSSQPSHDSIHPTSWLWLHLKYISRWLSHNIKKLAHTHR